MFSEERTSSEVTREYIPCWMVTGDVMMWDACAPSCPGAAAIVSLLYQIMKVW